MIVESFRFDSVDTWYLFFFSVLFYKNSALKTLFALFLIYYVGD